MGSSTIRVPFLVPLNIKCSYIIYSESNPYTHFVVTELKFLTATQLIGLIGLAVRQEVGPKCVVLMQCSSLVPEPWGGLLQLARRDAYSFL